MRDITFNCFITIITNDNVNLPLVGLLNAVHHADVVALTKVPFFVSRPTDSHYQPDIIVNKIDFLIL